ncbi:MAG: hypothetical protein AMK70_02930 [Nitrospira bacterium SG8_35_1]|nr:MAG: hypothetical protein AMK70_02930 [Nitrospira bacterium SG8_35_1]
MKLCVSSTGKDLDSKVAEHFGRAPYFLIIDTDTMNFSVIENTAQVAGRGAGISAAQMILDKSAAAVITGRIGPHAFSALEVAHVEIYEGASGNHTGREVVEKFKRGEYRESVYPMGGPGRGRSFQD